MAGGLAADESLNVVEMMNIDTRQWTTVTPFPIKCWLMSFAVLGDTIYLAGGLVDDKPSKVAFSCSVSNLRSSSAFGLKILGTFSRSSTWKQVSNVPVIHSTLVSFGDHMLAVEDDSENPTAGVYQYDSETNTWDRVSEMKDKRSWCLTATLPEDRLMVVGGLTGNMPLRF